MWSKLSICPHSANDTNLNAQQTLNEVISNHSANTLLCLKGHLYLHSHLGSLKIILCLGFITSPSVTCFSVRLFADLNLKIQCHYCPLNKTSNFGKFTVNHFSTIWYMIWDLLTAIGFAPSGSGWYNCTQIENKQQYIWGETIHKTIPKHRTQKIEKKKTNIKQIIKKHKTIN